MTPRPYAAPGPGTWEQDSTHFPRPLTQYFFDVFPEPFMRGFKEGTARYGLLFSHLEPALVNGFLYYQDHVVDPDDGEEVGRRFEAARVALESRLWREDLDLGIGSSCPIRSAGTRPFKASGSPSWTRMVC